MSTQRQLWWGLLRRRLQVRGLVLHGWGHLAQVWSSRMLQLLLLVLLLMEALQLLLLYLLLLHLLLQQALLLLLQLCQLLVL